MYWTSVNWSTSTLSVSASRLRRSSIARAWAHARSVVSDFPSLTRIPTCFRTQSGAARRVVGNVQLDAPLRMPLFP